MATVATCANNSACQIRPYSLMLICADRRRTRVCLGLIYKFSNELSHVFAELKIISVIDFALTEAEGENFSKDNL